MAKKKKNIPQYGTVTRKGVLYYRTRILDADGKQVSLYGTTCEELYDRSSSTGSILLWPSIVRSGC